MENKFIVMWDEIGLECIIPVDIEQVNKYRNDLLIAKLADDTAPKNSYLENFSLTMEMLTMRANVNSQRNYEIYILDTSEDINQKTLEFYFENNPQMIVDIIRTTGTKIFGSGRGKNSKPKIL